MNETQNEITRIIESLTAFKETNQTNYIVDIWDNLDIYFYDSEYVAINFDFEGDLFDRSTHKLTFQIITDLTPYYLVIKDGMSVEEINSVFDKIIEILKNVNFHQLVYFNNEDFKTITRTLMSAFNSLTTEKTVIAETLNALKAISKLID